MTGDNMQEVNWKTAENLALDYKNRDKILSVFFVDPLCDVCNEFVFNGVVHVAENYKDDYEIVYVKDTAGMPFPPTSWPTAYIFVPNCPNEMPLRRNGDAPLELVERDIKRQIKSMKTGIDLDELRNAGE